MTLIEKVPVGFPTKMGSKLPINTSDLNKRIPIL